MMSFMNSLFSLGALSSMISFLLLCLQRKHLLNALLSLEMIMLSIFLVVVALAGEMSSESLLIFVLLVFMACEAALGLSLLVVLIRSHGNDYVSSMSIHKC
uniref:NADH-ubiquinone oxidoreductase chain 4L n=1 Tax=Sypharochiton sinclairi TaxID=1117399 RepID=A0A059UFJ4_9MOLL|nr:NADH dehydrogenase subunit 4L [Sypharochiton sinclairi]AHZ60676.1 NADH dehydrogenase subunit 4L [Sypharochiton sinclairi]